MCVTKCVMPGWEGVYRFRFVNYNTQMNMRIESFNMLWAAAVT